MLDYPQYTRPADFEGLKVPEVLLSGHHENIRLWRMKESLRNTFLKRPDLLKNKKLSKEEEKFLNEIKTEEKIKSRSRYEKQNIFKFSSLSSVQ